MDVIKFTCPKCGQHYEASRERIGLAGKCGKCGARFRMEDTGAVLVTAPTVPPASPPVRNRTPTPVYGSNSPVAPPQRPRTVPTKPPARVSALGDAAAPTGGPQPSRRRGLWIGMACVACAILAVMGGVWLTDRRSSAGAGREAGTSMAIRPGGYEGDGLTFVVEKKDEGFVVAQGKFVAELPGPGYVETRTVFFHSPSPVSEGGTFELHSGGAWLKGRIAGNGEACGTAFLPGSAGGTEGRHPDANLEWNAVTGEALAQRQEALRKEAERKEREEAERKQKEEAAWAEIERQDLERANGFAKASLQEKLDSLQPGRSTIAALKCLFGEPVNGGGITSAESNDAIPFDSRVDFFVDTTRSEEGRQFYAIFTNYLPAPRVERPFRVWEFPKFGLAFLVAEKPSELWAIAICRSNKDLDIHGVRIGDSLLQERPELGRVEHPYGYGGNFAIEEYPERGLRLIAWPSGDSATQIVLYNKDLRFRRMITEGDFSLPWYPRR